MGVIACVMTSVSINCSPVCSGANQRIHQCSASLAFVRRINRWPVDSIHTGPVTQKMFPFDDDVIMRKRSWDIRNNSSWHGNSLAWMLLLGCVSYTFMLYNLAQWTKSFSVIFKPMPHLQILIVCLYGAFIRHELYISTTQNTTLRHAQYMSTLLQYPTCNRLLLMVNTHYLLSTT